MKSTTTLPLWFLAGVGALAIWGTAPAYPPAPHHLFYGLVRDRMGSAITVTNAEVIVETLAGVQIKTRIVPQLAPGQNYKLAVPMDAGLTADTYRPTALRPTVPFRMKVKIGETTYLPIEMTGSYANLGQPAQSTRLDLTLGEDSDNDGLPDAWEQALIAALGGGLTLAHINPGDDHDQDGISNLHEYLAGTYAFDPEDGFRLDLVEVQSGKTVLEFLTIRGRSYQVCASADLRTWVPIQFRIPANGPTAPALSSYSAPDVRLLRIEAVPPAGPGPFFFKAQVH